MISRRFHDAIDQWLTQSTWHEGHPSDDARFHEMLSVAESEGPARFDFLAFVDVVVELAHRHHPRVLQDFVVEQAHIKGHQADAIMGYLAYRAG